MQRWLDLVRLRLRSLFKRTQVEAELEREIQAHLDRLTQENIARGMSPKDANDAARKAFGNIDVTKEEVRDGRGVSTLENLLKDLRYSLRGLTREPMLLVAATVSIALGATGNIAIFSLARELLFAAPDVRDPQTLVKMRVSHGSHASFQRWKDLGASGAIGSIAGYTFEEQTNWFNGETTVSVTPMVVTANFFDVTGTPLSLGRSFSETEARVELEPRLAVVTHSFWKNQLKSDSSVVGRTLLFDGEPYTEGRAAVDAADKRLGRLAGDSLYAGVQYFELVGGIVGGKAEGRITLFIVMLGAVAILVLMIACANVAGLLIARATARRRETAIRLAIGGTRRRLLQQFLAEGFWLALIGTTAGLGLSIALMRIANGLTLPVPIPIELQLSADLPILAASIGIVILCTLFCALLAALGATRRSVTPELKLEEPKYVHRKITPRTVLLAGQVMFSTLLLVTALLFVRNLVRSKFMNPGFDIERTVVAQLGFAQRQAAADNVRLLQRAVERAQAIPGVTGAAFTQDIPLTTHAGGSNGGEHYLGTQTSRTHIEWNNTRVSSGYFETMGIRLVQGRDFSASDRAGAPLVAIINEEFVRRYFPGQAAVGNSMRFVQGDSTLHIDIVGVAENSKHWTLGENQRAAIYWPLEQRAAGMSLAFVVLRTNGDPAALINPVRQALGELDRSVSVHVEPMRNTLAFALLPSQVGAILLGSLGALGLILAAFGLYAIVAYNVSRRVKEIAIRGALGATRGRILRLVVRDVAVIVSIGLVLGLGLAAVALKPVKVFLVASLSTLDPLSFVGTAAVLGFVSALAGWLPARSATRVSPVVAMRAE